MQPPCKEGIEYRYAALAPLMDDRMRSQWAAAEARSYGWGGLHATRQGHPVSPRTVGRLLKAAGHRLQSNRRTKEGNPHPDRNGQFEHITATVIAFQEQGQPVISVDMEKREIVGEFKNSRREWEPQSKPE